MKFLTTLFFSFLVFELLGQLPNGSFELLDGNGRPKYWNYKAYSLRTRMDSSGKIISDSMVFDKQNYEINKTNSADGQNALELRNGFNFTANKALPGIVFASVDSSNYSAFSQRMIPVSQQPVALNLKHIYHSESGDQGYAKVTVYDLDREEIGFGEILIHGSKAQYSNLNVPIIYSAIGKASFVEIEIGTAKLGESAHLGSYLLIDDVQLSYSTSMDAVFGEVITFFPNPTTSSFRLKTSRKIVMSELEVVDMGGRVNTLDVDTEGVVNCDRLHEGVYVMIIKNSGLTFKQRLVVRR